MTLDRTIAPAFRKPEIFKLPFIAEKKLSNGIPYFEILTGKQAVVKIELVFNAGAISELKDSLALFTAKLLTAGTAQYSAQDIEEKFASWGAFIEIGTSQDHSGISVYCLTKYAENVLSLLKELIDGAIFPEEELVLLKNIQIQNLKVNLEKTSYLASQAFKKEFFQEHPYSRSISEDSINNLNRNDLLDQFTQLFNLANCNIFISGGGVETLHDVVDKVFGSVRLASEKAVIDRPVLFFGSGKKYISKEGAVQSSLRMAIPAVGLSDPGYPKLSFINEIFGGYFGSRLMKNIREDKGYTYGIHSSLISLKNASYLVVGTDVRKDVLDQTVVEVYSEMARLQNELIDETELETVKNYMIGSFLNSINSPFAIMEKFKLIYFHNLKPDFYESYYFAISELTSSQVLDGVNKYLKKEQFLEVAAG